MKNKKVVGFLLVLSTFILSSCVNPSPTSFSSSISEDTSVTSTDTSISEEVTSETYEKDDDGFYILEDDYFSYKEDTSDTRKRNKVFISESVKEKEQLKWARMYIGDKSVPIYNVKTNYSHTWNPDAPNRMNNGVTSIGLEGKVEIKVQLNFNTLRHLKISPISKGINYDYDYNRRVVTFTITSTGQYTIEFTNDRVIHLFVNEMSSYTNPFTDAIVFKKGVHNKNNDSRINSNNQIYLSSGQKVYIEADAFIEAKFISNNTSNIEIVGPGYIDGSVFERSATTNKVLVPIEFNYCSNITLKDFGVIDPAGWCFNMYFNNGLTIDNCKVISSRSNGDGISIQSCQNVNVSNSFVRSWDDSLVVKNYPRWDNRSIEGTTRNITFDNCILWTDLAQSMEVGFECVGEIMDTITFQNITVIHNFHKPIFSIHNGNNANIKNVTFKNITVEDASMGRGDGTTTFVELTVLYSSTWSDQHKVTGLGSVDTVELNNIKVIDGIIKPKINISGCIDPRSGYSKDPHYVKNVTFKDFKLYEDVLTSTYTNLEENYAQNVSFSTSGKEITGHVFNTKDISEYGNNIDFLN